MTAKNPKNKCIKVVCFNLKGTFLYCFLEALSSSYFFCQTK